ncbi:MAG: RNA methyltransferase [Oscillospiraceae bacterium]|nr:RNA methyltransferase [Oscillospiraceae bacterium]
MLEQITSRQNETVKIHAKLLQSAARRREAGQFLCEGARLCRDAAESGIVIDTFYATASAYEKYGAYCQKIASVAKRSYQISDHVAPLLSDTKHPQGVFCVCRLPAQAHSLETLEKDKSYLALEQMQDPSNFGTVLRTAEALGIKGVFLCGPCCDPFGPKALRGSMGAVFRLPLFFCQDGPSAAKQLGEKGFATFASVVDSSAQPVTSADFSGPSVLFIGNEGNGLTENCVTSCDHRITIPMLGRAESLNASAATSILLWEMMRDKGAM